MFPACSLQFRRTPQSGTEDQFGLAVGRPAPTGDLRRPGEQEYAVESFGLIYVRTVT